MRPIIRESKRSFIILQYVSKTRFLRLNPFEAFLKSKGLHYCRNGNAMMEDSVSFDERAKASTTGIF